jgi:phenylalanine-4-hydroxylase
MERPGIPDFEQLSARLHKATGWSVVAVPGLVPDEVFFEHLSQRRFVAGRFIRKPEQLDYLQEPDIFHDVFGHVPLLAHPVFADYMQAYGQGGLRALGFGAIHKLARLYWYTVEFGLIRASSGEDLRIYGAGIVSSHGETRYAIDSFDSLLRQTLDTDFGPLYAELEHAPDLAIKVLLPGEHCYGHRAASTG